MKAYLSDADRDEDLELVIGLDRLVAILDCRLVRGIGRAGGGGALTLENKYRIDDSDGFIALVTKSEPQLVTEAAPQVIVGEYQHALARGKRAVALVEKGITGLPAGPVQLTLDRSRPLKTFLETGEVLKRWKETTGYVRKVRLRFLDTNPLSPSPRGLVFLYRMAWPDGGRRSEWKQCWPSDDNYELRIAFPDEEARIEVQILRDGQIYLESVEWTPQQHITVDMRPRR